MGDPNAARPYIKESQRPDSIDLGDRLFSLAMADDLGFIAPRPMNDPSTYLPEYRGLATCGVAFDAILRESFEEAWELTRSANYTNQLHHDFGLVLGYHARKRMDRTVSYKHEQPLARIAKRGFPNLLSTVQAVEKGEFDSAIQSERRMLQLVA